MVGAGPCGLRAAIELKLMGAKVTIVEKRQGFSRNNILSFWDWVRIDLQRIGADVLCPTLQTGYVSKFIISSSPGAVA